MMDQAVRDYRIKQNDIIATSGFGAGDKVLVEISPYDLSRGRITYRERNAGGARPTTNKNNPKRNNK